MRAGFIPWVDAAFDHWLDCQRVGLFVLGCIEREQVINVRTLTALWLGATDGRPNATQDDAMKNPTPLSTSRAPSTSANDSMFGGARPVSRSRATR